ncbi:MAG: PQQ-binding-like beta-propeller repeat protein [Verrucomicrobiaceae bacterium]|nr:PQQ-binding-like beta-propeller repeat protein [Verrucomicrobiaceae bacterium]
MPPLFPIITTLIIGGLLAYFWITDNVMRSAAVVLLPAFWSLLNGLWWALRKSGHRLKRLGIFVLACAAIVAFFRFAVRHEGSADGSAWPQLAFVWQKKDQPVVPPLAPVTAAPSLADTPPPAARDMPRFLGEKGDGVLPAPEFHTDWAAHPPREMWRIQIGTGWSGFAVAGHRAITQEQRGEIECVTCYDLRNGTLLWSHTDKAFFTELMGGEGPRATPTLDVITGEVFALGATGMLNCLELATGKQKWQRDVLKDCKSPKNLEWGKSASPLLTAAHVICSGGDSGTSLIAYQRATGEIAWQSGTDGGSYASPVLHQLDGRDQIVTVNRNSVSGHDPADGKTMWTFDWASNFPKVGQPVLAAPDQVLITSSYGLDSHLLEIKAGAARSLMTSSALRTKFSSASVVGSHAYALDEGTLCCVDLKTGERVWREGRYGFGQQIRLGDDLLLIQAEKGHIVLVKASPDKLHEIARLDALKSKTWNPPTLAGRLLLLRNDREAVCYELPAK